VTNQSGNLIDKLWDIFSSMKMGLFLLALVALGACIGTLFPQETLEPDKAQAVSQVWQTLGFTNVYSSPWFLLLLGLLCINLIVCSIQRFTGIYQQTYRFSEPTSPSDIPQKICVTVDGNRDSLKDSLLTILKQRSFKTVIKEGDRGWSFVAYKKRFGVWGSFITHLSFVILLSGALVGSLFGFQGFFMVAPGTTIPIQEIAVDKGVVKADFSVRVNGTEDRKMPTGEQENWYSDLSIIESGKEVARGTISVNHPFTYKGITFYQNSFRAGAQFTATVNGEQHTVILPDRGGRAFVAPGTDLHFIIGAMKANPQNPMILYQVYKGREVIQEGTLSSGQTVSIQDVYHITLERYAGYTGIQVKSDPGINIVWIGCGLLILGLLLSFYWRSRFILGIFEGEEYGKLTLGARSGKISGLIQDELAEITRELRAKALP